MGWSTLSFIPSNICLRIEGDTGSGACGFNSYCSLEDDRKICQCPLGYTFIDPEDVMKGCKQNFVPQSCDKASEEMDLFEFREMINTDWPLSDYEYYEAQSEDWCRQVCLSDCFCAAAISEMEIVGRRSSSLKWEERPRCWRKGSDQDKER